MKFDRKHIGAHNELLASVWLIQQGYEVFRNLSQHGDVDIIATKGDELLRLDVKTAPVGGRPRLTLRQVEGGVKGLWVYPDGTCKFDLEPLAAVPFEALPCAHCGFKFRPNAARAIYCTPGCRTRAHIAKTGKTPRYGRL